MSSTPYFTDIKPVITAELLKAKKSIQVALAFFTDNELFEILWRKAASGLKVEVIISDEDSNFGSTCLPFQTLITNGGDLYFSINGKKTMMHHKFCIIDNSVVITGSYNWSYNAQTNRENIIVFHDETTVTEKFTAEFEDLKKSEATRIFQAENFSLFSGFVELDRIISGFKNGTVTTLSGRTGMGTTSLALSIAKKMTEFGNIPGYITLNDTEDNLTTRLISSAAGIDSSKLKAGRLERYEWEQINAKIDQLSDAKLFIQDLNGSSSIEEVLLYCKRLKIRENVKFFVIDYLERINAEEDGSRSKTENILLQLKKVARELNIAILLITKIDRNLETRGGDKKPQLSDLGIISQYASTSILLYRPEYYRIDSDIEGHSTKGLAELIVAYNRVGGLGTAQLKFTPESGSFADIEPVEFFTTGGNSTITTTGRWDTEDPF